MSEAVTIDTFAGPGGWSVAMQRLGIRELGIELDAAACATRAAAGHWTVRADVASFPVRQLAGRVRGNAGSPPCTTFSAAGDQAGNALIQMLSELVRDMFAGRDTRGKYRQVMAGELTRSDWHRDNTTAGKRAAKIRQAVRSAGLVAEPARFIEASNPEWVALEQVPAVLPLWQVYAAELRRMGYSAWCGKLNAADYGVPQTRERAILIASRVREVWRPEPTHYDARKGAQLWGAPWVSMADALGWGATERPVPSVTAGGTATGGAEPIARGGREALDAERDAGRWALRIDAQRNATLRSATAPAPAPALKFGHSAAEMQWVVRPNAGGFAEGYERSVDEPSPTLRLQTQSWHLRRSRGASVDRRDHPADEPAPTITSAGGKPGGNLARVAERPSTTVQGDPRIGRPGHKDRDKGESQFEQDSVRITVEEAATLQSFPPGYPFQGTKTAKFRQVGDAMPPFLAEHVLAMATGIQRLERAA